MTHGFRTATHGPAFDAVLCDLDNVVRFYDVTHLAALERAAGLPEGTTEDIAYAPETDLPLLLGRITLDERAETVGRALAAGSARRRPGSWAGRSPRRRSTPTRRWSPCCAGYGRACRWSWSPTPRPGWPTTWPRWDSRTWPTTW